MGVLDWFQRNPTNVHVLPYAIWITSEARFRGIVAVVRQWLVTADPPIAVVLAAHFQDCLDELDRWVDSEGLRNERVITTRVAALGQAVSSLPDPGQRARIEMIVTERHPLLRHDERLIEAAKVLACQWRVAYHLSLDDPVLRACSGPWLATTLKRLGMTENEPIRSDVVGRRLMAEQQKIELAAYGDSDVGNAIEWFRHNCPDRWRQLELS